MIKKAVLVVLCLFVLFGCYATEESTNTLTPGNLKKNLIKGKTTQAEVIKTFGSPNVISKTATGQEMWTYDRQAYDANASGSACLGISGGSNALGMGALSQSSSSSGSRSIILTMEFDKNDIVSDYSYESRKF